MSDPKNPEGLPEDAEQAATGAVPPAASDPDVPSAPVPPVAPEPPAAPPVPPAPPAPEPPQYQAPAAPQQPYGAAQQPYGSQGQAGYGQTPPPPPGYGAADYSGYAQQPATKSPVLSIISLIAGIVGVVGSGIVIIPIIGSILQLFIPAAAVILGFLGKKKEPQAKGMWLTGIILGFIGLAIAFVSLVIWIVIIAIAANDPSIQNYDY